MADGPFLQGQVKAAFRPDPIPKGGKAGFDIFQPQAHHMRLVAQEAFDVCRDGVDHVAGMADQRAGIARDHVGCGKDDAVEIGVHDPVSGAAGIGSRHLFGITGQMHIGRVPAIGPVQPPQHPRQAVVGVDMAGRIGETVGTRHMAAGFVPGGPVRHVTAGAVKGGRPATAGAKHENVAERRGVHRSVPFGCQAREQFADCCGSGPPGRKGGFPPPTGIGGADTLPPRILGEHESGYSAAFISKPSSILSDGAMGYSPEKQASQ